MKHEQESHGIFRRIGAAFTRNFGLKILSLALAILIYEVLKPESQFHVQPADTPVRSPGPDAVPAENPPPAVPEQEPAKEEATPPPKANTERKAKDAGAGAKKAQASAAQTRSKTKN